MNDTTATSRPPGDTTAGRLAAVLERLESRLDQLDRPPDVDRMIDVSEFASMLGLSRPSFDRLKARRKIPPPLRFGSVLRWRLAEIKRWLDAGCPDAAAWEKAR